MTGSGNAAGWRGISYQTTEGRRQKNIRNDIWSTGTGEAIARAKSAGKQNRGALWKEHPGVCRALVFGLELEASAKLNLTFAEQGAAGGIGGAEVARQV